MSGKRQNKQPNDPIRIDEIQLSQRKRFSQALAHEVPHAGIVYGPPDLHGGGELVQLVGCVLPEIQNEIRHFVGTESNGVQLRQGIQEHAPWKEPPIVCAFGSRVHNYTGSNCLVAQPVDCVNVIVGQTGRIAKAFMKPQKP